VAPNLLQCHTKFQLKSHLEAHGDALTYVFGEAIIEISNIHNLFIQYPNNTYFSAMESSQKWG
jgi:hypothetical protein